ncbi:hypothetical protein [Azospirillum canadense]|uniref:hypothetical protein n=1 Tax=Azospirillum canadense TaxID=403962 RepID=UPI0022273A43|nr:hypothetical protein [Azospirillum canadense]MCW2239564.1 hypothetical protein [Azospirillum canadense]
MGTLSWGRLLAAIAAVALSACTVFQPFWIEPPVGTTLSGHLSHGMLLPRNTSLSDMPVLIRLAPKSLTVSGRPLADCVVLGRAQYNPITQRADVWVSGVRCTDEDGVSAENTLSGYVVGADGRVGLITQGWAGMTANVEPRSPVSIVVTPPAKAKTVWW